MLPRRITRRACVPSLLLSIPFFVITVNRVRFRTEAGGRKGVQPANVSARRYFTCNTLVSRRSYTATPPILTLINRVLMIIVPERRPEISEK